jgi:hypothetical protein
MTEHEVHQRKRKDHSGLTDQELVEAMTLYMEKVKSEIFESASKDYGIKFSDTNLKTTLAFFMDMALTRGMELGGDTSLVVSHYKQVKALEDLPTDYEFQRGFGVSGVLLPDGNFIKCGNAEHHKILSDIDWEIQNQSIFFSSFIDGVRQEGNISHSPLKVFEATQEQKDWIAENKLYFDVGQLQCYLLNKKNNKF